MFLYHYLVAKMFLRLSLSCPIPGMTEGLLPRLAFGPVTKTAWMLYHSLGGLYIAEDPMLSGTPFVFVSSYQKLIHFLLISRLDIITVICGLHKANPNALSSSERGSDSSNGRVTSLVR